MDALHNENTRITASNHIHEYSPEINFDFENNHFVIKGNAYPENAIEFFDPILTKLSSHLSSLENANVTFIFDFIYFSSSTAKTIMSMFDELDAYASN